MELGHLHTAPPNVARQRRGAVLLLLAAAFFWGSGNVANKTVLDDLDPLLAVAGRCLVAAVFLWPFAARELAAMDEIRPWARSALLPSGLFAVALMLQQWAYQSASVTNASFLVNTACVLTPVIAFLVLRDRLQPVIALASALTLIGVYLMSGVGRSTAGINLGDLGCLVSALFYAGWMVALSHHATHRGGAVSTTLLHVVLAAAGALVMVALLRPDQPGTLVGALPELFYLGVFSTALAFWLTAVAQAHVSASITAVLVAAESIFGTAGAVVLLGERPGPGAIAGACVMLAAIALAALAPAADPLGAASLKGGTTRRRF